MTDFNLKKKMAEQAILIADNFLESDIAKEILLKNDEKTPKQLTPRIEREIEEHLEMNKFFIKKLKEEEDDLPTEIFNEEFKSNLFGKVEKFDDLKKDITNNFNFSQFNEIYIENDRKNIIFYYTVGKNFVEKLFVVALAVVDNESGKQLLYGDLKSNTPLVSGTNLTSFGLGPFGNYTFTAITNDRQTIKVEIRNK